MLVALSVIFSHNSEEQKIIEHNRQKKGDDAIWYTLKHVIPMHVALTKVKFLKMR